MLASLLTKLLGRRFGFGGTRLRAVLALYEHGRLSEAERACASIDDAPRADIDFVRGLIAQKRGDLAGAAAAMRGAVDARPDQLAFRAALGEVLFGLRESAEALSHFDAFLNGAPPTDSGRVSVLLSAGRCCLELDEPQRAARYFERALKLQPGDGAILECLSVAQYDSGKVEAARSTLEPAVRAGLPGASMRKILLIPAVYESNAEIDATRERLSAELDQASASDRPLVTDPVRQIGVLPFYLAYHNRNNAALLRNVCRAVRRSYPAAGAREPSRKRPGGRIRVGFVSTHFYLHSVGRTTIGLIRDLPRDRFSVYVFAVAPKDDPLRAAIEHAADHYRSLPLALDDVRRAIESAELDVLVFADIGMHPLTYFLALWRLAPVQVTTWGHSETSGVDTIDYYWSARGVEIADAQSHYTERLVRPEAFFLPGYARPAPPPPMTRRQLGLPEKQRLYACLQNIFKLHPDYDGVLASLLERDPEGEILLIGSTAETMDTARRRFARTIGPDASRIRFLPKVPAPLYLSTLAAADVALDPLYFGGCNSSLDAFAMGVPVVTLPGDHLYGRFTLGLYREMDLEDCVASTPAEYVDIALRLATDADFREAQRHALCERSGVLYERTDITLAYADFLEREAFAAT